MAKTLILSAPRKVIVRYLFEKYVWSGKLRKESKDKSKGFRLVSWVYETDHFLPSYYRKTDEITGIFSEFLVKKVHLEK